MARVICVTNHKGGVAKTTTTLTLGAALQKMGKAVALIGLDQQRNLELFQDTMTQLTFAKSSPRALSTRIEKLSAQGMDFVLIDCPPRLGPEVLHALRVSDLAVVPIQPEALVVHGLSSMMQVITAARDPLREGSNPKLRHKLLLTKCDAGDPDAREIEEQIRALFAGHVFPDAVQYHRSFNQAAMRGQSVIEFAPRSQGARVYRAFAKELSEELNVES